MQFSTLSQIILRFFLSLTYIMLVATLSFAQHVQCHVSTTHAENFSEEYSTMKITFSEPVRGMLANRIKAYKARAVDFLPSDATALRKKLTRSLTKKQKRKIRRNVKHVLTDSFEFKLKVRFKKKEKERRITVGMPKGKARTKDKRRNQECTPVTITVKNPRFFPDEPRPTPTPIKPQPTPSATPPSTPSPSPSATPPLPEKPEKPTPTPKVEPTPDFIEQPAPPKQEPAPPALPENPVQEPLPVCNPNAATHNDASNLPVFPTAKGHGSRTTAGSGRNLLSPCTSIYKITTLKDSGAGSLRECIEASGPRTCIFETSGIIWATSELRITNPHITIAGQTAPAPGIVIRGSAMSIEASDVLIRHMQFRVGDDPRDSCCDSNSCSPVAAQFCSQNFGSRDGLRVFAKKKSIKNIIIDHVSIAWAIDEGFSLVPYKGNVENVTFSNSIIASGLDITLHPEADPGHSKGVLINSSKEVKNFSFFRNLLAHNADRNIRIATPIRMEYVNNVVYNWARGSGGGRLIEMTNSRNAVHAVDLVGNYYKPGLDSYCPETFNDPARCFALSNHSDSQSARAKMHYVLRVGSGISAGLTAASRYFLSDNLGPTRNSPQDDEWAIADKGFFKNHSAGTLHYPQNRAQQVVASSNSLDVLPVQTAYEAVLANAGARPEQRDEVDAQTIAEVRQGIGRIKNCVTADGSERCALNAGGWPLYEIHTHALIVPPNPHSDSDGDGYTNFEEWLESFARALE